MKDLIEDTVFTSPTGEGTAISTWSSEPHENLTLLQICDPPRENQQKGDNTGTRAMHGHASVTTDTDMRIFNEKTKSVTEAFVWQDITR